jgi:endonuclease/exonuclease/phosphatase family metal-dependent hydrolase
MLLCNFNVNNLFVRYKFGKTFPGDQGGKSAVAGAASTNTGYLPLYQKGAFEIFNAEQRKLAALAITQGGDVSPDVVCVQEVESLIALREFNDSFLGGAYPYVVVLDSRDLRQIDVGILSKYPIDSITTHVDDTAAGRYIFSRDCLEVRVRVKKTTSVTLFINHFKSKLAMGASEEAKAKERANANLKRKLQADTVVKLLKERFPGPEFKSGYFAVLGDLNDTPLAPQLSSLCVKAGLVDALATLPPGERWTHYWKAKNSVSQLDHVLLSPALSDKLKKDGLYIERRGIGFRSESKKVDGGYLPKQVKVEAIEDDPDPEVIDFQYARFDLVSSSNVASDHCAVFLDFKL